MELAVVHAENAQALKVIYSSLLLICKIFNSLNTQVIILKNVLVDLNVLDR